MLDNIISQYILHPEDFDDDITKAVLKRAMLAFGLVFIFDVITATPNILLHGLGADMDVSWGAFILSPTSSTLISALQVNYVWLFGIFIPVIFYILLPLQKTAIYVLGAVWATFVCFFSGAELGWGETGNIMAVFNMTIPTALVGTFGMVTIAGWIMLFNYIFSPIKHATPPYEYL